MQTLLTWLGDLPPVLIYLVAAALVFAETALLVGLAVPGEITLLSVGFLSYTEVLNLPVTIAVMVLAGLAGDAVAYVEGRRAGPRLRAGRLGQWVGPRRWDRAEALFARHAGRAVFLGRFIAFARTLTPRLAGMARLPYRRVLWWDLLGVLGWVGGSVVAGLLAGGSYVRVAHVFGRATGAVLMLALLVVALVVIGRYLGRHRNPVSSFGARLVDTWPLRRLGHWYTRAFRRLSARFGPGVAVAVNLVLGVVALLGIGVALAWTIDRLVRHSGFPLVDSTVAAWFAAHRTPAVAHAAQTTLSVLRGSILVTAVAVVGIALNPRPRSWRGDDLVGVLGTAGAFIPLLILALAADWTGVADTSRTLLPNQVTLVTANQVTLVTASLGMLAWLLSRRTAWAGGVATWLVSLGGVLLVAWANLYLGLSWPSEVAASILLGSLWVLVFVVAWHTRDRLRTESANQQGT